METVDMHRIHFSPNQGSGRVEDALVRSLERFVDHYSQISLNKFTSEISAKREPYENNFLGRHLPASVYELTTHFCERNSSVYLAKQVCLPARYQASEFQLP